MVIQVKSLRSFSDLILRIIEIFFGIRLVVHFFSEDGFLGGMASDIGKFLEYIDFDDVLPTGSGIETPLAFLAFVLFFMLIGYTLIVFLPKYSDKRSES